MPEEAKASFSYISNPIITMTNNKSTVTENKKLRSFVAVYSGTNSKVTYWNHFRNDEVETDNCSVLDFPCGETVEEAWKNLETTLLDWGWYSSQMVKQLLQETSLHEYTGTYRYNKSFYLLSPDGFLLTPSSGKHTSMQDAKKEFDTWVVAYRNQGYYRTAKGERIPSDVLWHRMIIHSEPFYNV